MAVAFDAGTNGTPAVYDPTCTFSHTCTGSDRVLFVGYQGDSGGSDLVTGVTYNSVALTLVASYRSLNNRWVGLWRLVNPASGANNVVITVSASSTLWPMAWSYTGATTPNASANTSQAGSGNFPFSVTTVTDNSWAVGIVASSASSGALAPGANTTERLDNDNVAAYDGNAAVSPAGSSTLNVTITSNADAIAVALPPAGGGQTKVLLSRF